MTDVLLKLTTQPESTYFLVNSAYIANYYVDLSLFIWKFNSEINLIDSILLRLLQRNQSQICCRESKTCMSKGGPYERNLLYLAIKIFELLFGFSNFQSIVK